MIEARDVSVAIGGKRIVANVDFEARPGEIAAIVGPNGSGKTTFLRALSGDLGYSGEVTVNGRNLSAMKPLEAATLRAVLALAAMPFLARGLNALALGEATAGHLGIPVQRLKYSAIVGVSAAVGASVAVSGGIGFVGIVVPHLLRLLIGPDNRYLLPASALLGAALLLLADAVARTIVAPAELPIGIVTAVAGAPFFLWILLRKRGVIDL
ncbi:MULTISPECIES: iron chelate uptake ABC transporter family permease subunit [unclassified Mesorhizobium]|uniref:iron chelate uptake ABC transporter family permease subunit n=1 Tax=unclassified Mesorhizobium TaxID=325217 RepID=UPI00333A1D6B